MPSPELVNEPIYLSLENGEFDASVYQSLPEWLQGVIFDAPEFSKLGTTGELREVKMEEELPF